MKKILQKLQDNRGTSTLIYSIYILMVMVILTIIIICAVEYRTLTLEIQTRAESALEIYINTETKNEINSIKSSVDYLDAVDTDTLTSLFAESLYLDDNLIGITTKGREYTLSDIKYSYDNDMNISVIFTLEMPFYFTKNLFIVFDNEILISTNFEPFY